MALLERLQLDEQSAPTGEELNRLQTRIEKALAAVAGGQDKRVSITFTGIGIDTRLYHQLGRPLVGYRLVRANGAIIIFDGSPSLQPDVYFNLRAANATGVATVEVF